MEPSPRTLKFQEDYDKLDRESQQLTKEKKKDLAVDDTVRQLRSKIIELADSYNSFCSRVTNTTSQPNTREIEELRGKIETLREKWIPNPIPNARRVASLLSKGPAPGRIQEKEKISSDQPSSSTPLLKEVKPTAASTSAVTNKQECTLKGLRTSIDAVVAKCDFLIPKLKNEQARLTMLGSKATADFVHDNVFLARMALAGGGGVVQLHEAIRQNYEAIKAYSTQLTSQIEQSMTRKNETEMIENIQDITLLLERVKKKYTEFTHAVLTLDPTLPIKYRDENIHIINPKVNNSRKILGDGNCFLSSFTTRYLENLIATERIPQCIAEVQNNPIAPEKTRKAILRSLQNLQNSPVKLEEILGNNGKMLPFISYFRHIAGNQIKELNGAKNGFEAEHPNISEREIRELVEQAEKALKENPDSESAKKILKGIQSRDFIANFLVCLEFEMGIPVENLSVEDLVEKHVIAMGVEFSEPMSQALCACLDFAVSINTNGHLFNSHANRVPDATFRLKNNHYEVLY